MPRVDFEWQVGGESGEWETIAEVGKKPRRKWSWRVWVTLAVALLASSAITYFIVYRRVQEINRQVAFQIQSVIDLEAQAWERANVAQFLAQQDDRALAWYAQQSQQIRARRERSDSPWPSLSAQVQSVNIQGDIAWVEVRGGNSPTRQMRFYRRADRGWLHTAPDVRFWGRAIEYHYGNQLIFRFYHRDRPYVEPLIEPVGKAFYQACQTVGCSAQDVFEVIFYVDTPRSEPFYKALLPSPWIAGIPVEGKPSDLYARQALRELALRVVQVTFSGDYFRSGSLTETIAQEYATWVSARDLAQAPLLGRIIARHGESVLPDLFRSLRRPSTLGLFLSRWLSLGWSPSAPSSASASPSSDERALTFFEALLNIEREALLAGQLNTFALFQDSSDQVWVQHQNTLFNQVRADLARDQADRRIVPSELPLIEIDTIQLTDQYAILNRKDTDPFSVRPVTIFRLQGGDWKHNDFASVQSDVPAPWFGLATLFDENEGLW